MIFVSKIIVPNRVIKHNKIYKITYIANKFIIRNYSISLDKYNQFLALFIKSEHPNSENGEFCIPKEMFLKQWNKSLKERMERMLSTFNLDNCFYVPWNNDLKYIEESL